MTMKNCTILSLFLLVMIPSAILAQENETSVSEAKKYTPSSMWEITPNFGYLFVAGDVDPQFGYAGGISIRKATDYLFSLRADFLMGKAKGENGEGSTLRMFETDWMSGSLFGVLSLNSLNFNKPTRSTHLYMMLGGGANYFQVPKYRNEESRGSIDREWASHASLGAGIAFRLGSRVNIGLEHQASVLFGRRADLVDGSELENGIRTPFRDILNYSNLRIGINIGSKDRKAEPLYWINPLQVLLDDMNQAKSESEMALEDSDGDGVIDQLDKEPDTAPSALVDTKGRTLDSDRDGVPDHLDKEPYYTPREGERVNSEGIVENPVVRDGVTEERVRELIDEALQDFQPSTEGGGGLTDLFLPMIHFGINSSTIKYSDYGTLASIARVMKNSQDLRLVITGYTDETGTESLNEVLSYERAKSVIDHLVDNHGIGRGRLVLRYGGQSEALVPATSSYMNRRVEFGVAQPSDVEMDPPENYNAKKKSGY